MIGAWIPCDGSCRKTSRLGSRKIGGRRLCSLGTYPPAGEAWDSDPVTLLASLMPPSERGKPRNSSQAVSLPPSFPRGTGGGPHDGVVTGRQRHLGPLSINKTTSNAKCQMSNSGHRRCRQGDGGALPGTNETRVRRGGVGGIGSGAPQVWRRKASVGKKSAILSLEPLSTQIPTGNPPAMWGIDLRLLIGLGLGVIRLQHLDSPSSNPFSRSVMSTRDGHHEPSIKLPCC